MEVAQPAVPAVYAGSMLMNCWRHLAAWRSVQSSWRRKPVHTSSVQPNPQAHSSRSHSSSQQQRQPPGPGDAVWDISAGHALLLHTEQQLVSCAAQQLAGVVAAALLLFHWEVIAAGAAVAAGAAQEWLLSTVEWLAGGTPGEGPGARHGRGQQRSQCTTSPCCQVVPDPGGWRAMPPHLLLDQDKLLLAGWIRRQHCIRAPLHLSVRSTHTS